MGSDNGAGAVSANYNNPTWPRSPGGQERRVSMEQKTVREFVIEYRDPKSIYCGIKPTASVRDFVTAYRDRSRPLPQREAVSQLVYAAVSRSLVAEFGRAATAWMASRYFINGSMAA